VARPAEFGANWWAKRWIGALDRIGWAGRLARGRSYARQGRVLDVEIGSGIVNARVKGSRTQPYRVTIAIATFPDEVWNRIVGALSRQALFAAKLLAGELPVEVVELCQGAQASLFPEDEGEMSTTCSCPDWVNPCKHVAAVHYALAAEFDRDPFLLFRLRGRTRDELTAALRARRGAGRGQQVPKVESASTPPSDTDAATDGADPPIKHFWEHGPELGLVEIEIRPPEVKAAVLKRLGRPPVWGGQDEFRASLEQLYSVASASVRDAAVATSPDDDSDARRAAADEIGGKDGARDSPPST